MCGNQEGKTNKPTRFCDPPPVKILGWYIEKSKLNNNEKQSFKAYWDAPPKNKGNWQKVVAKQCSIPEKVQLLYFL